MLSWAAIGLVGVTWSPCFDGFTTLADLVVLHRAIPPGMGGVGIIMYHDAADFLSFNWRKQLGAEMVATAALLHAIAFIAGDGTRGNSPEQNSSSL
ncbi:MAG: hypothetical protein H6661_09040 [Ardenticatenaceae bacterium]|nr:hypothetical protein [Ardenticatenaceae bacterium]